MGRFLNPDELSLSPLANTLAEKPLSLKKPTKVPKTDSTDMLWLPVLTDTHESSDCLRVVFYYCFFVSLFGVLLLTCLHKLSKRGVSYFICTSWVDCLRPKRYS